MSPGYDDELDPLGFQAAVTWGSTLTQSIAALGAGLSTQEKLVQMVDVRYPRPTTFTLELYVDASQGGWTVGDSFGVDWLITYGTGKARIQQRFPQQQTIAAPFVPFPTPAVLLHTRSVAIQMLQVIPRAVQWNAVDANPRSLSWSAWCAPLVR
jgi:hypothetical protein